MTYWNAQVYCVGVPVCPPIGDIRYELSLSHFDDPFKHTQAYYENVPDEKPTQAPSFSVKFSKLDGTVEFFPVLGGSQ
jgi:hypothetical protein